MAEVIVYGADWCPDCIRSKRFLERNGIEYQYIDIEKVEGAAEKVVEFNEKIGKGPHRSIPVILLNNEEKILSEPTDRELGKALGIEEKV